MTKPRPASDRHLCEICGVLAVCEAHPGRTRTVRRAGRQSWATAMHAAWERVLPTLSADGYLKYLCWTPPAAREPRTLLGWMRRDLDGALYPHARRTR